MVIMKYPIRWIKNKYPLIREQLTVLDKFDLIEEGF